jgi:Brp/Blh family beta-carotene 15,15'-monooxygenase
MCSAPLRVHEMRGVTRLGGRAGAIKPGTGYAFKNMHRQAVEICQNLQEGQAAKPLVFSARFRFYDRLLLWILCNKPEWGKPIFQQLFKKNRTPRILRFLDEKTTLIQDLGILMSLPFRPFLAALRQDLKHNPPAVSKPAILTAIALILWLIYGLSPSWYLPLQWVLLSAGLLAVGIPHGAVDHLLESGKIHGKPRPVFILKYLGIMLLYLLLWQWLPVVALVIFLLYSAFHFGQADIQEWQIGRLPHIKSLFWGMLILSIILFSHVSEVAEILKGMRIEIPWIPGIAMGYAALIPALAWGLYEKKTAILWSLLMLIIGMQLPVISAFGLYFIGQHSTNGWTHLKQGMQAGNRLLFLKAMPFTLGAVALLIGFFVLNQTQFISWNHRQFISVFFVFLACLSMPHVWAMHRFYKQKK